ncbi:hypothetical protein [Paraburkholderia sediminicola]|uniref:hypothetical protein n=1 Tax=Paraburkholderia sediminicola TaxID=458836 RepID=UPI0038BA74F2
MNGTAFDEVTIKGNLSLTQVALYLFALLRVVAPLMTATDALSPGITPKASTTRRVSTTNNAVVNILCFTVGYALLARCLNRCAGLVWRIASGIFLINTGVAALATAAQRNLYPVLTRGVAIAGTISVWNGRGLV